MKKNILFFVGLVSVFYLHAQIKLEVKGINPISIVFETNEFDFGVINENGGRVSNTFYFKNTGNSPIKIKNVDVECGCTNSIWTTDEVKPGGTGFVKATFNPIDRPGGFSKKLTVKSESNPEITILRITGTVSPSRQNFADLYKFEYGRVAINTNTLTFKIKNTGYDSSNIFMYNLSNKKIKIVRVDKPTNIVVSYYYDEMLPMSELVVKIKYYPKSKTEFGPSYQEIKLYTTDDTIPVKTFHINGYISEDFSALDEKALKKSPKIVLDKTSHDFGQISFLDQPSTTFAITNKGKEDLKIRRIVRSCNCLIPSIDVSTIKKGKKAFLKIAYSSFNVTGNDERELTLITNDPKNSEITLKIKANISK